MKIETIKKMKNGKYKLEFQDGKTYTTYDNVILENNLLFHKEIEDLDKIFQDTDYYDIYYKMVRKIGTKLRSTYEIKEFLKKENVSKKEEEEILKKLEEAGLLNDKVFAKCYVSDKVYLSMEGPYKIRKELEEHHIKEEYIEEAMDTIDETKVEEKLTKYIQKKINSNKKYSNYLLKQKIMNECINKGYSNEMISSIFDQCSKNTDNVMEQEADRLIRKLQTKYEKEELKKKVKEKLYQKGFSISDIQSILEQKEL